MEGKNTEEKDMEEIHKFLKGERQYLIAIKPTENKGIMHLEAERKTLCMNVPLCQP